MPVMPPRRQKKRPPQGKAIEDFRHSLGLTIQEAADRIGVHWRTWAAWEAGRPLSKPHQRLLQLLREKKI